MAPPLNPPPSSPTPLLPNILAELDTTRVLPPRGLERRGRLSREFDYIVETDVNIMRARVQHGAGREDADSTADEGVVLTDEPEALFISTLRAGDTSRERRRRLVSGGADSIPTNLAISSERTTAIPDNVDDTDNGGINLAESDWFVLDSANNYSELEAQRRAAAAEEASERATVEAYSRMFTGMRGEPLGGDRGEGSRIGERGRETSYWRYTPIDIPRVALEDRESFLLSHGVEITPGIDSARSRIGSRRHSTSDGLALYPLMSTPPSELEGQSNAPPSRVVTPLAPRSGRSSRELPPPYDSAPTPPAYPAATPPWQPIADAETALTVPSSPNPYLLPRRPDFPPPGTNLFESSDELEWRRRSSAPEPTPGTAEWRRRYPYGVSSTGDRQESDVDSDDWASRELRTLQRLSETRTIDQQAQPYADNPGSSRQRAAERVAADERRAREQGPGIWLLYCGGEEFEEALPQGFSRKRKHQPEDDLRRWGKKELPPNTEGCGTLICARGCDVLDSVSGAGESIWSDYPPPVKLVGDQEKGTGTHTFMRSGCNGCRAKVIGCKSCGNIVGRRIITPCSTCPKFLTRNDVPKGVFLWSFSRSSTTLRPRSSHTEVAKSLDTHYDDESASQSQLGWKSAPHPQDEFENGLIGEPVEWLTADDSSYDNLWWLEKGIGRQVRELADIDEGSRRVGSRIETVPDLPTVYPDSRERAALRAMESPMQPSRRINAGPSLIPVGNPFPRRSHDLNNRIFSPPPAEVPLQQPLLPNPGLTRSRAIRRLPSSRNINPSSTSAERPVPSDVARSIITQLRRQYSTAQLQAPSESYVRRVRNRPNPSSSNTIPGLERAIAREVDPDYSEEENEGVWERALNLYGSRFVGQTAGSGGERRVSRVGEIAGR